MKKTKRFLTGYEHSLLRRILQIMKLTTFILFLTCYLVSASVYSQSTKLNLNYSDITFEELFLKIEEQSEFRFAYSNSKINLNQKVYVNVSDATLTTILNEVLPKNVTYDIIDRYVVITAIDKNKTESSFQQKSVNGKISDETGNSLPGVTVVVKGTTNGTVTDFDGNYTLSGIPDDAILQFTFVGMKAQEIVVGQQSIINVTLLEETIGIEEVVAIGYGTQKKATVTGAISTVSSEDIGVTPSANLTQGLAGTLSGVIINQRGGEPGDETTEIFIRGRSTTEDASPLYVIDGIVRNYNGLDRLDANEIESITVLKDASAAIYGSRAANGVILITTKRGVIGKPKLNLTYNHGFSQATRIPRAASSGQWADAANLRNEMRGLEPFFTNDEVQKFYDGSDPVRYPNTNWYDLVFKDWQNQDKVNLDVTGGSENIKFFISGGYLNQGSPYDQGFSYNKQFNIRSNIDATINKNLNISLDISGRKDDIMTTEIDFYHVYLGLPYQLPINPDGSYGQGRTGENAVAMVREKDYGYTSRDRGVITSNLSAVWNIPWVEGLSLSGTFAYDYNKNYQKEGENVWYWYSYNPDNGSYTKMKGSRTATPTLLVSDEQGTSTTANLRLAFVRSYENHNIDAFIGYEQNKTHYDFLSAGRDDFLSFTIEELFAGTANKNLQSNNGYASNTGRQNIFGRIAYDFANKYLLQFQLRYDGSQNFPKNSRWGLFPGISAGWVISEESFINDLEAISYMKLRGSWGKLGNDRVGAYQFLTSYEYGDNATFSGISAQGLIQSGAPNPNITWEVATSYDIGLETQFWNQLLGVDVDLFKTRRNNILATRNASVPDFTGITLPDENIGVVDNKGVELTLSHRNSIGDFNYFLSGNFTFVRNKVIDIDEVPNAELYQNATGHPIGAGLYYEIDNDYSGGIFDSDAEAVAYGATISPNTGAGDLVRKDMNNDGVINSLDRVRQNLTATPEIVYGFNMRFSYKAFDLALNWQGQARARISPYGPVWMNYDPVQWGNFNPWLLDDGWTPENTTGSKPRPGLSFPEVHGNTTFALVNAAFFRLKNAELGYNIPSGLTNKIGLDNARVYISGYNLFSLDKLKDFGVDPEQTSQATFPPTRIINLGVSLTF